MTNETQEGSSEFDFLDKMTIDEKIKYFDEKQAEILSLEAKKVGLANVYRLQMRRAFGIADNDRYDVLKLVKTFKDIAKHE